MAAKPQNLRRYIIMDLDAGAAVLSDVSFQLNNTTVKLNARPMAIAPQSGRHE